MIARTFHRDDKNNPPSGILEVLLLRQTVKMDMEPIKTPVRFTSVFHATRAKKYFDFIMTEIKVDCNFSPPGPGDTSSKT